MAQVFEGKVRKLGNSMAVIIPKDVLTEVGVREGDVLKLAIPVSVTKRKRVWKRVAGIDAGLPPFSREEHDRIEDW
ncbi:MAG: AbrB/MazE/SpoVT family DNA-binding domain-containing protein [Nitrososphaerota archaeon]|jgi:antitoxin component of MazEF toxin-antitoxin module|nr:AbrB/MazE/SpoVT family DNA-binding domain-containing protein [Nitrososphaerota archaeon]MDG6945812.1 AbrB/MazE/SpoVT family DNA-binding domain-containing protein [Nitrososphaerota archaeon]